MMFPLNYQTFTGWILHKQLQAHSIFKKAYVDAVYYDCTKRESIAYTNENGLILSIWITKERDIILTRLELPEEERGKGLSIWILRVLKYHAQRQDKELIVKYPDNREFWNHYADKYGGVVFRYR